MDKYSIPYSEWLAFRHLFPLSKILAEEVRVVENGTMQVFLLSEDIQQLHLESKLKGLI